MYKAFGTKAALAKAVFDFVIASDDEPVPVYERPEQNPTCAARSRCSSTALRGGRRGPPRHRS
ncbi:hypothetical protein [Nocardia sp. NPDC050710]|uniref:hypothetical protein n=1 Tax=Nocardia sp. NPDC050710 TaxID=3157220 RepID=UPI0033C559FD